MSKRRRLDSSRAGIQVADGGQFVAHGVASPLQSLDVAAGHAGLPSTLYH